MDEFTDWQRELAGSRLVSGRWVRPRRQSSPTLALAIFGAGLLVLAGAMAVHILTHGA